jgi:cytochrome c biogenesis protein CcmG/thiol:disulfide interchange protein DsbE
MNKSLRIAWALALGVFILGAAASNALPSSNSSYPLAPDFALTDLRGKPISLSQYKGKVLVLNFWATRCPPCREEIPDFIEAYKKYKSKGLEIIGIHVERLPSDFLLSWVEDVKINYPVAFATAKIIRDYEPGQYIPATIVIDKTGRIRQRRIGMIDLETLVEIFQKLAQEK